MAQLQADVGDIVELAPAADDKAEDAGVPLALLLAIWQTKKGQCCFPAVMWHWVLCLIKSTPDCVICHAPCYADILTSMHMHLHDLLDISLCQMWCSQVTNS